MRHSLSVSSSRSADELLHPKLQKALSCLDFRLEDELLRYRRQRSGLSVAPIVMRPKKNKQDVDSVRLDSGLSTQPEAMETAVTANSETALEALDLDLSLTAFEPELSGDALLHIADRVTENEPPNRYRESSEYLLRSLAEEEEKAQVERRFLEQLATPLGIGSMLTLLISSAMFGYGVMNPSILAGLGQLFARKESQEAAIDANTAPPSDEAAIPNSPPLDSEEFVDLRLDSFAILRSQPNVPASPSASPRPAVSPAPMAPQAPASEAQLNPQPTQPNPPAEAPSGGAAALVVPPIRSVSRSNSSSNYRPARSAPVARSAPRSTPVTRVPASDPLPPAPRSSSVLPSVPIARTAPSVVVKTTPAQSGSYGYKIEVPYTGDQSLEAAQQAVPDAYLRSDGKIQLGAAGSQAEAQQRAQTLKSRGISAQVRQR
jgi:hypothetical protein